GSSRAWRGALCSPTPASMAPTGSSGRRSSTRSPRCGGWADGGEHPRAVVLLPRRGGVPVPRRRGRGRGRRGTVQPPQARPELPRRGRAVLPVGGERRRQGARLRRLLREAAAQVRPAARERSRDLPARRRPIRHGDACLAQGEVVGAIGRPAAPGLPWRGALLRAPPLPRGRRVPPVAVRGGGDRDRR